MSSRDRILKRLRDAQTPFEDIAPIAEHRLVTPIGDDTNLQEFFIQQAKALGIKTLATQDEEAAIEYILKVLADDKSLLAWDLAEIPLNALGAALEKAEKQIAKPRSDGVRVGLTGVDAAIAATASIVVSARVGRYRSVSLLPYVHIAVLKSSQILPHFEAWINQAKAEFRSTGNHIVITGPSRTADIAMELVLGAHGPAELHLIILDK
jgi:L-lactate dehydrogenase complex protein LldG